jgi:hypothetical protein
MHSFEEALAKHQSIVPIRGRQDQNTRPLVDRKSDRITIRVDNPESPKSVIVRLYRTDVVTYNIDGTIDLDPYPSRTTNMMVYALLGRKVSPAWASRDHGIPNHVTYVEGRYYHTPEYCTIDTATPSGDWQVIGGTKPFGVPQLDRKRAKQALKDANYYTFRLWLLALIRLGDDLDPRSKGQFWNKSPANWSPSDAVRRLQAGPDGRKSVAEDMSRMCAIKTELDALRRAVYNYYDVCDTLEVPYFEDYRAMTNAFKMMRQYK